MKLHSTFSMRTSLSHLLKTPYNLTVICNLGSWQIQFSNYNQISKPAKNFPYKR